MDSSSPRAVTILGVPISARSEAAAIAWIERTLETDGPVTQIATYNPEYAIAARHDPAFHDALTRSELATADGVGITLAARLRRESIERVTGVRLLELLAATGSPLFLLGAGPGVAKLAGEQLTAKHPQSRIAGTWSDGTPDRDLDAETITRIRDSGARIVAVAYGAPGQVHWIERNRASLSDAGVRIAIGVGGALDYWSGLTPTPPALVRRIGIEWLWRLLREPRRWRRQLALPRFALLAGIEAIRERSSH